MSSGYTQCACRDCFDIAISDDENAPAMCNECEEAGCNEDCECSRDDAYGVDETCEHGNWVCSDCGHGRD